MNQYNSFDMSLIKKIPSIEYELEIMKHNEEIKQLCDDLHELHAISAEFNKIVDEQKESIDIVVNNIEVTDIKVEASLIELQIAQSYYLSYYKMKYGLFAGLLFINTPVAIVYGIKLATLTATTSLIAAYFIT